jgi:hydrogenase nickel incorporation protein HypA/HybF
MHERSLVRALLRQVQQVADENSDGKVVSIRVRVGEFSGVEPELLASAYVELIRGTPLCDATLDMEQVQLEGICDQCGTRFRIERFDFQCRRCGSLHVTVHGGEELLLESVKFEETKR